jgi:nitrite reductase/ring-hydroxylating ferredoxin subunit
MAASPVRTFPAGEPGRPLLHALSERLARTAALDAPADRVAAGVRGLLGRGLVKDVLSGVPLGHPLHPALTDAVIGTWTSATLLDLVGGEESRPAADKLVAAGLLASLPTAAAGASDWADTAGEPRRLGTLHALANSTSLALYGASYAARRRGRRRLGVALGLAGATTVGVGAWLGGALSYERGIGVDETVFDRHPGEWTTAARFEELVDDQPHAARVAGEDVVLVRRGERVFALADRCNHRSGPLHEGTLEDGCLVCPLHGSTFRLEDGAVARGPATVPQPAFDVRVDDGRVEVRAHR